MSLGQCIDIVCPDIFSYSGVSEILGSGKKQNITSADISVIAISIMPADM